MDWHLRLDELSLIPWTDMMEGENFPHVVLLLSHVCCDRCALLHHIHALINKCNKDKLKNYRLFLRKNRVRTTF